MKKKLKNNIKIKKKNTNFCKMIVFWIIALLIKYFMPTSSNRCQYFISFLSSFFSPLLFPRIFFPQFAPPPSSLSQFELKNGISTHFPPPALFILRQHFTFFPAKWGQNGIKMCGFFGWWVWVFTFHMEPQKCRKKIPETTWMEHKCGTARIKMLPQQGTTAQQ